jgi:hypothetical protein
MGHIQLDVVEWQIRRGESAQPFPGLDIIQELLDLIDVVFCHARTVDNIVDMFGKRLALTLELPELDRGDELQGLTERGGTGAAKRYR